MCGRFWRSTTLSVALFLLDSVGLLGGINRPILRELYWLHPPHIFPFGLWNHAGTPKLALFVLIWALRILALGRWVMALGFIRFLYVFHGHRYTCETRTATISKILLGLSALRLFFGVVLCGLFWCAYVPTVLPYASLNNLMDLISRGFIGPAVFTTMSVTVLDVGAVLMSIYYLCRQEQWRKFNHEMSLLAWP